MSTNKNETLSEKITHAIESIPSVLSEVAGISSKPTAETRRRRTGQKTAKARVKRVVTRAKKALGDKRKTPKLAAPKRKSPKRKAAGKKAAVTTKVKAAAGKVKKAVGVRAGKAKRGAGAKRGAKAKSARRSK